MNILSLFDGIATARLALKRAGVEVTNYYTSEIDRYASAVARFHYHDLIELGDVCKITKDDIADPIDLIVGGSPCTNLSICGDKKGLKGEQSKLFFEFVRLVKEIKPRFFVLENVASMKKEWRDEMSKELFGIEPVMIDAALVSAQQRKRLFWVGKRNDQGSYERVPIELPEDRHIYLKEILEERQEGVTEKSDIPVRIGHIGKGGQAERVFSVGGKSVTLSANGGGLGAKTGLYLVDEPVGCAMRGRYQKDRSIKQTVELRKDRKTNSLTTVQKDTMVLEGKVIRKLTPLECERLQSLDDNWTRFGIDTDGNLMHISNNQRYKQCGNGFNCEVVRGILEQVFNCRLIAPNVVVRLK